MVYHHVDCTLGPDPQGDKALMVREDPADPATWVWTAADKLALNLIAAVHGRGMRIIFDGVFNHVSSASPFFRDVVQHQQQSRYQDWFVIDSWDDPAKGTRFAYRGWEGVPDLPAWRQDAQGAVSGPRAYIFACTRRWLAPDGDPRAGIDGWRLDVAHEIAHPFWKAWRTFVKQINPEAYLVGEVIDTVAALKPYLQDDEFDAVMNYNVGFACADYFINQQQRISTTAFDRLLRDLREAFAPCVAYVQQNLLDSHDSNRVTSHIVNPDGAPYRSWNTYHSLSKPAHNPAYATHKPTDAEYAVQKLMALFQMTYIGAPMIYYGDEVGMWGANDPCCRKPMVWDDLAYAPEACMPDGVRRANPDVVTVNTDLLATYRQLIHLRHALPALSLGDFTTILTDDARQLYAYRRIYSGQAAVVALNNTRQAQPATLEVPGAEPVQDVLAGGAVVPVHDGKVTVVLPPLWGVVLVA
jgi:glycosidase